MVSRIRVETIAAILVVSALGFAAKFYPGPGATWINHFGPASIAYEIFLMLVIFTVVPRRVAITPIAIAVCVVTCSLEFLQKWQPSWLQAARATFVGRTLLGHDFSWWDFPAYPVGCVLGWFVLRWIVARDENRRTNRPAKYHTG